MNGRRGESELRLWEAKKLFVEFQPCVSSELRITAVAPQSRYPCAEIRAHMGWTLLPRKAHKLHLALGLDFILVHVDKHIIVSEGNGHIRARWNIDR